MSTEVLVALLGTAITSLFKAIKFVKEGELGIRLRFGKAERNKDGTPTIINPGFVLMVPFVDTLQRHHVRQQTLRLDDQKVMIKEGLIFNVSAVVMFRVKDIYKALFEINELDHSLVDLAMGLLRDILAHKVYTDFANIDAISDELFARLKEKASEWGVEFIQFKLTDCAPTAETAPLVNAKTGVRMKLEALRDALKEGGGTLEDLPPDLAAVLIGVPMVVSVTAEHHRPREPRQSSRKSFLEILFSGQQKTAEPAAEKTEEA